ncbi:hypothetical protein RHGRI_030790 [Rhododendron griersonianum]|uniref:Uncharacterized protein n=1 Tax=Rhododendron griersonianum TaxID=479676 RepID=A0AAV6I5P8_9ERIC|nr:hypothetical protein RHGRI_030790 [Rhododendron griersonianum]
MADLQARMQILEDEVAHLREVVMLLRAQLSSHQSTTHMLQKAVSSLQDDVFEAKMEALDPEFRSYKPAKEEGDSDNHSDDRSDAANDASDVVNSEGGDDGGNNEVDDAAFDVFNRNNSD